MKETSTGPDPAGGKTPRASEGAPSNLLALAKPLPLEESFEPLVADGTVLIERIVSVGHASPPGFWYDQPRHEWVLVMQGSAVITFDGGATVHLSPGDHLLIPARTRHRVDETSVDPPCLWLAVHWTAG